MDKPQPLCYNRVMAEVDAISFEQLDQVRKDVATLVPGYYIKEMDPFQALDNGQGNCFTNAIIAGAAIVLEHGFEPSVVWNTRLHGAPSEDGMFGVRKKEVERQTGHIELVVPRGIDEFDVLSLGYGLTITDGDAFKKEDKVGGDILNYNFSSTMKPDDLDISHRDPDDEPWLKVEEGGEIVTTAYGEELHLKALDWQEGADEYLDTLRLPPLDYDKLIEKTACFLTALHDGRGLVA